jgi:hypothetical protein
MEALEQFETYIAAQKAMGIQFIILGLLILESISFLSVRNYLKLNKHE